VTGGRAAPAGRCARPDCPCELGVSVTEDSGLRGGRRRTSPLGRRRRLRSDGPLIGGQGRPGVTRRYGDREGGKMKARAATTSLERMLGQSRWGGPIRRRRRCRSREARCVSEPVLPGPSATSSDEKGAMQGSSDGLADSRRSFPSIRRDRPSHRVRDKGSSNGYARARDGARRLRTPRAPHGDRIGWRLADKVAKDSRRGERRAEARRVRC
jgi:hypothetical protein